MIEEVKMANIGWIIASVGTASLVAVVCIVAIQRMLRDNRSGFPLQKESARSQEFTALGSTLVVLGIIFGEDRLIGYSFMSAGILLSVVSMIKSRRNEQRSVEVK